MNYSALKEPFPHLPVLYNEIILAIRPRRTGKYVDGTLGAGGHAYGILQASAPDGMLLGLDVDPQALILARERLKEFGSRAEIRQSSYTQMGDLLSQLGWDAVDGILLDLGLSSMQLDTADRGFSFMANAPLDMRFDPANLTSAASLVNNLDVNELADILFRYGEERWARQIARAIIAARPLATTKQLAEVIDRAVGGRYAAQGGRIHPATRTFQALRIAVNRELESIEMVLPQAIRALNPGGRLAVISFHSLEDRLVKECFRRESRDCVCPPRLPVCICGHRATIREINRRPLQPLASEIALNPRARSAKLRIAEKLTANTPVTSPKERMAYDLHTKTER